MRISAQERPRKRDQFLVLAAFALNPQETAFQPAAVEEVLELPAYIARQAPALGGQLRAKYRVVLLDELIQQGVLGALTYIAWHADPCVLV